jgi:hypothetical protein
MSKLATTKKKDNIPPSNLTSFDAPPLDFSFKSIKELKGTN